MRNYEKRWLVASLKRLLIKELECRGFVNVPLSQEELNGDREFRLVMPFGRFRREGSNGIDLVEVQLASYGRPKFRLNVGVVPLEGVLGLYGEKISAEEVWVHWLDKYFELYGGYWLRSWFAVRRWPWKKITRKNYDDLVTEVLEFMPEVEHGLKLGVAGSHMRTQNMKKFHQDMREGAERQKAKKNFGR
jgi:hypothetical protein